MTVRSGIALDFRELFLSSAQKVEVAEILPWLSVCDKTKIYPRQSRGYKGLFCILFLHCFTRLNPLLVKPPKSSTTLISPVRTGSNTSASGYGQAKAGPIVKTFVGGDRNASV